jgi:ADP-heptose:LPS heptosyltransferase
MKVLIEMYGALGDTIAFGSTLFRLKEFNPEYEITLSTNFNDLFKLHPCVDQIVDPPGKDNQAANKLKYWLRRVLGHQIYLQFVEYYHSNKIQNKYEKKIYIGWVGSYQNRSLHLVDTFNKQLNMPLYNAIPKFKSWPIVPSNVKDLVGDEERYVVINVEAGWESRKWNKQKWEEVADFLNKRNYKIFCIGTDISNNLDMEFVSSLVGKTNIMELIFIIKKADILITVDSAAFHIGNLVSTPTICLFGPVDPQLRKYENEKVITLVSKNVSCISCFERHDLSKYQNHCLKEKVFCMMDISVDDVKKSILSLTHF